MRATGTSGPPLAERSRGMFDRRRACAASDAEARGCAFTRLRRDSGLTRVVHIQSCSWRTRLARHQLMAWVLAAAVPGLATAQTKSSRPRAQPPKAVAVARPATPPSPEALVAISRRGQMLAEHDSVAWLGGDAMGALSTPAGGVRRLISHRSAQGWEVGFGTLSDDGSTYLLSKLAIPGIQRAWASTEFDPPQPDSGYFARAGRAIETSLSMFKPVGRGPYIATVIPDDDEPGWWVYVYPAPVVEGVWPRGGDYRFRVSPDGRVMTELRQLHQSITEYSVRSARSANTPPDRESLVSGDTPEDTDVFHVLQRRPALPELMLAGKYHYRIDIDGSIHLLPNN